MLVQRTTRGLGHGVGVPPTTTTTTTTTGGSGGSGAPGSGSGSVLHMVMAILVLRHHPGSSSSNGNGSDGAWRLYRSYTNAAQRTSEPLCMRPLVANIDFLHYTTLCLHNQCHSCGDCDSSRTLGTLTRLSMPA